MKVDVVSRKLVKPWKPTPSHLSTYKISLMDEINPSMHVTRILYFKSDHKLGSDLYLEESLAQVLTQFYLLAGRYDKLKCQVDCNDEGVEFSTAKVHCKLEEILDAKLELDRLNDFLPIEIGAADETSDPMLAIQINRFDCGGVAIGICVSHRIFDSASLGIFLAAWANAANDGGLPISPTFDSPAYFPPDNLPPHHFEESRTRDKSIISRRYNFDKHAISKLRGILASKWKSAGIERPPSRVAVVAAVLTRAIMRADRARHGQSRAALIGQVINVRERTIPPLPKHACGTWVVETFLELSGGESQEMEKDLPEMALRMRNVVVKCVDDCARILSDRQFGRWLMVDSFLEGAKKADSPDYKAIFITDFSKFGEYELDFGFGKPVWVSIAAAPLPDHITLLNTTTNDGIDAWVSLHESDIPYFDQDPDIRMLTT